jgi:GNAT superfamily N-acetyltransferase
MKKERSTEDREFLNELTFEPLTKANWPKLEQLFGEKGACGNCWCMYYRLSKSEFNEGKINNGNKDKMKDLVWGNKPTGMLAFYEGRAIAWCALAPREDFSKLARSRVHKPIDNKRVWSIPCFFVHKDFRLCGISVEMLKALINYAKQENIKILEAYPTTPTTQKLPDSFAWIGLYSSFKQAGFIIVDQTSRNRPMVRHYNEE